MRCEYFYGFSATVNKAGSTDIPKDYKLKEVLNPYVDSMVSYYGFTAVDLRPKGFNITVKEAELEIKLHPDLDDRNIIIRKSFESSALRNFIMDLAKLDKVLFIPVNNKGVFYSFLRSPEFREHEIMMISGDGYIWYHSNYTREHVSLERCEQLVDDHKVKLVFGTVSSFRGINFHNINSILLTFETQSAIIKQCIGRLTRQKSFDIYLIKPVNKISFLTNAYWSNLREIRSYYSECNLKFVKV